jgi:hypothetical protein
VLNAWAERGRGERLAPARHQNFVLRATASASCSRWLWAVAGGCVPWWRTRSWELLGIAKIEALLRAWQGRAARSPTHNITNHISCRLGRIVTSHKSGRVRLKRPLAGQVASYRCKNATKLLPWRFRAMFDSTHLSGLQTLRLHAAIRHLLTMVGPFQCLASR